MQREKRRLLDILPEVQTALSNTVKGWDGILASAKNKLQKDLAKGKNFPQGVQVIDISNIWIDYSVQRDIKHKHVAKIIERFDNLRGLKGNKFYFDLNFYNTTLILVCVLILINIPRIRNVIPKV